MKKSLKYLGATAAALLAVAPVAAPAVASVASFGVAHADTTTPSFGDKVDAAVKKQVTATDFEDFVSKAFDYAQQSTSFDAADATLAKIFDGEKVWNTDTTNPITHVAATVTGTGLTAGMSGFIASNAVEANKDKADTTYSVTLSFYTKNATAATYTKAYSIVVPGKPTTAANKSAVKTTPYSFKSGDTLPAPTDFVASVASHISGLTKADGSAVTVSNANIVGVSYGNGLTEVAPTEFSKAGVKEVPDTGLSFDTVYVQLSGVKATDFGTAGTVATNQKFAHIMSDKDGKNAIANLYTDSEKQNVYVAVPVYVVKTTPNTDPATTTTYKVVYTPTGSAADAKPVYYTDGQTVALLNGDYKAKVATSFGEFIINLDNFAKTLALYSKKDADKDYSLVAGSNSDLRGYKTVVAIEKLAAAAGVSYDETKGTFTSAGTLVVPVKVTATVDGKSQSVTVNVPVKVEPTPHEVEKTISLTGNTTATLTVGDKFDPMAGISATAANGSAIPASYINVVGKVDTTKAGTYTLTYTVTDPFTAKTKSFSRVVTVVAPADVKAYTGTVYATQDNATLYTLKNGVLTANASTLSGKKDSAWKAFATLEQNGVTYYKLGSDSQWAKAVTTDKPAPVSNPAVVSDFTGVVYANVSGGSPVYTLNEKTGAVAATGRALAQGSAWKGFKKAVVDGVTYVNLGGNQWIKDFGASYTTKVSGVATLKHSAALYSNDAVLTARTLAKGSRYKVSAKVQLNGVTYYQIGGLVKASDVSFR